MNLYKKIKNSRFYTLAFLSVIAVLFSPISAYATDTTVNGNITKGLTGAGLDGVSTKKVSADSFSGAVVFIITIAAIWTLACIIFAAMKISGAQGNAQKRVEGIVGLAFAGAGAWVIYNAYDIFGWFSSIGTGSTTGAKTAQLILFGM